MRIKCIRILITMFLLSLVIRLCFITVISGDKLKKEAFLQQTYKENKTGYVYDDKFRTLQDKTEVLSHVLGYCWDGGASGIQKAFNDNKLNINNNLILKDALGNEIDKNINYSGVKLTIDYNIQKITEQVMDSYNLCGAVVIVDTATGGITAMASGPDFNRNNIASYYNSTNGELINRAISDYNVGSVFKVITAAAALETKYSYEYKFNCVGKTNINGRDFYCNNKKGHGNITLTEGFAYSCNCMFYNVGINTGYETIRNIAYNFGFGEEVLKINGFLESKGNIPENIYLTDGDVANISIGQGGILATPLQIADMMCTIANDGIRKQIKLINGVVEENGNCNEILTTEIGRIISSDTARNLKEMLKEAVEYGTGKTAKLNNILTSGKTATAETGWYRNGELMTHGWFAGFYPSEKPKYVCVVLAEGGSTGSISAAPVFKEIGEKILDL